MSAIYTFLFAYVKEKLYLCAQNDGNMRKIVFILLFLPLLLAGCSCPQHKYHIAVSQCLDDAWRAKMNSEMSRELLLYPDMTLHTRIAYGSNELQCAQIDSFISEHVDLLIVSPNETEEVKPAVSRAYQAGIPVIVADRRVSGDEWTAFVGGDNVRVGELMADWILQKQRAMQRPIHVLEVTGLPNSAPTILRHRGMMAQLQTYAEQEMMPVMDSVMGSWMKDDAYRAVTAYLCTHADVDIIVAQNDLMAIGSAEAVRDCDAYPEGSVPIMGVDGIVVGLQAIVNGTIECTAAYPSRGDMIIETAARILANEPFVRDTILETLLIDAGIANPMLAQYRARLHDLETLHIVQLQSESRWQQIQSGRTILIVSLVLVAIFFFLALGFLIYSQRNIKKEIKREILPQLEEVQEAIQLNQRDVAFGERMKQIVEDHLTDPDLNVEFLGSQLALSRTQIFRRVKAITGKGPLDYIRERRLIRADELLRTTDMTIQQVAMQLCFSSPGYFTKCYKDYFGKLPSAR